MLIVRMSRKRGWRDLLKNNLVSLGLLFLICFGVVSAGNIIFKDGNLDADKNITAAGKGTFGSTYQAKIGDGNSPQVAGDFVSPYNEVYLCEYGQDAVQAYSSNFFAALASESNYYAGVYANDYNSNEAYLADSSYAGSFNGDVYISGALTYTGGSDPPYVLYFNETKESIIELTRRYVPTERANGMAQVYIPSDGRIKWFKPLDCGFYGEKADENGFIVKTLIETYDDGNGLCYNSNVKIVYSWDRLTGRAVSHQVPVYEKISIPEGKEVDRDTGELIDKAQKK